MVKITYNGTTIDKWFNVNDALELINAGKEAYYIMEWVCDNEYDSAYLQEHVKDYKRK